MVGATEQRDIGELVEDMPKDGYGNRFMADKRGSTRCYTIMQVAIEQFPSSSVVAKGKGVVKLFVPIIPGFEAVLSCHSKGYASFPKKAFEVSGPDRMGLLEDDQWNAITAFGCKNLLHGWECRPQYTGEFADGAVVEADGEIGKAAGLPGGGLPPSVAMTIDDKGGPVGRMAGDR